MKYLLFWLPLFLIGLIYIFICLIIVIIIWLIITNYKRCKKIFDNMLNVKLLDKLDEYLIFIDKKL